MPGRTRSSSTSAGMSSVAAGRMISSLRGHDPKRAAVLANGVEVLLAEVQAEPCVDERRCRCGHEDVMVLPPRLDPRRRGNRVELADDRRLGRGMARGLDPDVRPPDRVGLGSADEEPGDRAVPPTYNR